MFEEKPPLMVQLEIEAVGNGPLVNKPSKRMGPSSEPPASVVPLLPPMVVLATLRAVPAVVESVLTIEVLFCVAVTVPPPVAVKESFAPVVRLRPPVKLMVAVLLLFRKTPVPPFDEIAPPNATVPPAVLPCTSTTRAVLFVMVPL